MCRPTVMHVFMFKEVFILETTSCPTDRPTSYTGAVSPAEKLLCSNWLCEERYAVTPRQVLLHECCECGLRFRGITADTLLHELRREADSLSLARSSPPLVEPGHSQESASWLNIGANQLDRHPSFLLH